VQLLARSAPLVALAHAVHLAIALLNSLVLRFIGSK